MVWAALETSQRSEVGRKRLAGVGRGTKSSKLRCPVPGGQQISSLSLLRNDRPFAFASTDAKVTCGGTGVCASELIL